MNTACELALPRKKTRTSPFTNSHIPTPEGERRLEPGDVVAFPEGEAGAHQLRNDSDAPFRVLIGSTKSGVYVAGYPDSGKLLVDAPSHSLRKMLPDAPELDYWDRE